MGLKFDQHKLRYDLIPPEVMQSLAKVLTYGSVKYAPNSWQTLADFNERYYAALMRHLMAWRSGEHIDAESGLLHLEHALCNAAFLSFREVTSPLPSHSTQ